MTGLTFEMITRELMCRFKENLEETAATEKAAAEATTEQERRKIYQRAIRDAKRQAAYWRAFRKRASTNL
jgi:NurA-like 5'-3' nuclease